MSHFITAVFHHADEDIESLLAPFNEQDENYMKFYPTDYSKEELEKTYKEVKEVLGCKTLDEFMRKYYGFIQNEDGEWGYMSNSNAKWDWYQVGGRWNGFFRTKDGQDSNEALAKDLDLSPDPEVYRHALRFWEVIVEGSPLQGWEEEADFFSIYKPTYYIDQYGDKEHYAQSASSQAPWAFVTADGDWLEKGQMGWWCVSDATQETRSTFEDAYRQYVADHPDLIVTAVDCHI